MTTPDTPARVTTGGDPGDDADHGPIDTAAFLASVPGPGNLGPASPQDSRPTPSGDDWNRGIRRDVAEVRRPAWHTIATPEPVTAAWSAVEAASAVLQAATDRVLVEVDAEQAQEAAALQREVRDAVREGRSPTPAARRDWHVERVMALEQHRAVMERFHAAREAYRATVAVALPSWRRALVDLTRTRRAEAAAALEVAMPAVDDARQTLAAVRAIAEEVDYSGAAEAGRMVADVRAVAAAGREGVEAAHAWLTSEHPALTGEAFAPDSFGVGPQPPLHARAATFERGDITHLAGVEAAEGWAVTAYSWDLRYRYAQTARDHGHEGVLERSQPPAGSIGY